MPSDSVFPFGSGRWTTRPMDSFLDLIEQWHAELDGTEIRMTYLINSSSQDLSMKVWMTREPSTTGTTMPEHLFRPETEIGTE